MGIAASSLPPEAAAPTDPPAKQEIQPDATTATVTAPSEGAASANLPAKEEAQRAAPASAATAPGGDVEEAGDTVVLDAAEGSGEEEEAECGFCLFMKGGGCKEEFVGWEKCVEEAEVEGGDVVERCFEATAALRKCMDAHAEYYEPILRAERAMAEDLEAANAKAREASPASPSAAEEEEGDKKK